MRISVQRKELLTPTLVWRELTGSLGERPAKVLELSPAKKAEEKQISL